MSDNPEESANSLGLTLDSLKIEDGSASPEAKVVTTKTEESVVADGGQVEDNTQVNGTTEDAVSVASDNKPTSPQTAVAKDKKKQPYINPDRVKTGGAQRDKLSEEELTERMARIREQNEKIKQRREDVLKDEEEFRKTQEAEKLKQARSKKVQESINRAREQNARRKLDKVQNREWDTGKPGVKHADANANEPVGEANAPPPPDARIGIRGGSRGGARGGNVDRGRGRGRGNHLNSGPRGEKPAEAPKPAETKVEAVANS
ncbi:hypothetical protein BXZ70DRAFT_903543 [Cristinia sonorae]|uniref:Uncharacterized protein n=1 Tax=Cristinia sonorae TaxID=1940300 RepID=A0A8K0UYI5_9AGAR|nr:hypothetical protein BXZ70DRAFT_903543 [Cristinia sonorae]